MKADCHQTQLGFQGLGSREVVGGFDGGEVTSDAGGLLLREAALQTGLLRNFARCFVDNRDQRYVSHSLEQLVSQRVFALALGYEDVNDHDDLRRDPLMALLCERTDLEHVAGKSTVNRLEQVGRNGRYHKVEPNNEAIDQVLVDHFLSSFREVPVSLALDLDATDAVLHGDQEGRFFHGYYDNYCYLPLLITCGDHVLCVRLRRSNIDGAAGCVQELERVVKAIRARFAKTQLIVRADSGFAREELMGWCESNEVDYVLGLARNERLEAEIADAMENARKQHEATGDPVRIFRDFMWSTKDSWSRRRRVVGKAEYLEKGSNPRFIVSSLDVATWSADKLYEKLYCARGDMENRIKEHQSDMFGERLSTHTMKSNQLRLYFSTIAYMLITTLRRAGLVDTELAKAQATTIRTKLLKIGAVITISTRRVVFRMASGYPYQQLFATVLSRLKLLNYAGT